MSDTLIEIARELAIIGQKDVMPYGITGRVLFDKLFTSCLLGTSANCSKALLKRMNGLNM